MDGWVYRRPWILLALGILVAWFSIVMKAVPIMLKATDPNLALWTVAELDLAASVVDPTLVGLAGGLIASAFVAKLQFAHERDVFAAKEKLLRAVERMGKSERAEEDLRLVGASLSDSEFAERLEILRVQKQRVQREKTYALSDKLDAEQEVRQLGVVA